MAKMGTHNMVRAAAAAATLAIAGQLDSPTDESSLGNESRAMTKSKKGKHNMDRAAAAAASFLIAAQADSTSDESTAQKRSTPRWTPDEIERLCRLVPDGQSYCNWDSIASHFPGRTAKQCRERYSQHSMAAERKIGPWSTEEDRILVENQKKFGNKWSIISVMLPGRTDNDVKNRWWSQQRAGKRAEKRAAAAGDNGPPKKKSAPRHKPTKKCALTPMKNPALNEVKSMNSTEFVEKELELPALPAMAACPLSSLSDDQLLDIVAPPVISVSTCPFSIMSDLDSHAASSLVALKSDRTPAYKDSIATKEEEDAAQQVCLQSSVKWSYPPGVRSMHQENIAQQVKKWTYPPPAQYDQARAAKAIEMFSPPYKQSTNEACNCTTPAPATLHLDTLPLCDSGPFVTRTPMPDDQVQRACRKVVTMSNIKPSPIEPKIRSGEPTHLFSPLPFYETPESYCEPGLFIETAAMLQSGMKDNVTVYPAPLSNTRLPYYPSSDPVTSICYPSADV